MAEALLRDLTGGRAAVASAGSQPAALHPDAIRAMDALGLDIRGQRPKPLSAVDGHTFDYVITVCDRAREVCPVFKGGRALHWGFPDPAVIDQPDERARAFASIARGLQMRMAYFLATWPTS
jgi:protein-tyrosine-phosphatase